MDLKPANLKRYGNVARLLYKYGGSAPAKHDLATPADSQLPADPDDAARGEELAKDLEALGPTFIKLGQLLSSRGALIPVAYADALERLQDSVDPFPYEEVERIVTEANEKLVPVLEKLAEEFNIDIALHNHPNPSYYWQPEHVLKAVEGFKHVGSCADVGHWQRSVVKPIDALIPIGSPSGHSLSNSGQFHLSSDSGDHQGVSSAMKNSPPRPSTGCATSSSVPLM